MAARGAAACGSRMSLIARGVAGGAAGAAGWAAWNSRGAAANCSCAADCSAAGFGNSGFDCCGQVCSGVIGRGISSRASTGGGDEKGAAGGSVRTVRRSPSIVDRRSTTWPSVLLTVSSESCVRRSVSDWLKRMSDSSRLTRSTMPGSIDGAVSAGARLLESASATRLACWRSSERRMSCRPSSTRPRSTAGAAEERSLPEASRRSSR